MHIKKKHTHTQKTLLLSFTGHGQQTGKRTAWPGEGYTPKEHLISLSHWTMVLAHHTPKRLNLRTYKNMFKPSGSQCGCV